MSTTRFFPVYRDLDDSGRPELVDRPAEDLTDAEIRALGPEDQAYVCAVLNVGIDGDEVYALDPADVAAKEAA